MNHNLISELRWRGMLQDTTPGTEEQLLKEMTAGYIGFDPTAVSLHIGNLATIMLLKHFQLEFLDENTLRRNQEGIRKQLEKFLDFDCGANSAEIVNNYDWFKDIGFLEFLREVGKHLTINYMMSKDSVKNRMETGISFTEFSYQLLQGYDFYWLWKNRNCKIQMGGSDQWGNITTGTELIRRKSSGEAFALTTPLVTKADGSKFGKSEGGNIWLDPNMTSPYKFYQFWLNVADSDLPRLLRVFSLRSKAEIETMESENASNPNAIKKLLAEELTERIHSKEELIKAQKASNLLFGKATLEDFESTDDRVLAEVFDGVPQKNFSKADFENLATATDLLALVFETSKTEIKKLIKNNGISVNQEKITVEQGEKKLETQLLKNRFLLFKKGKEYRLVQVEK
jgi:tyrosyl-tRNA synthetase